MKLTAPMFAPIIEVDGELCIEFSDELMETLDFKVGDMLQWEQLPHNEWKLTKIGEKDE